MTHLHLPRSLSLLLAKRYLLPTLVIGVVAVALILSSYSCSRTGEPLQSGPQTMKEVMAVAEKLGLHYRGDQQDGTVNARLTISESPLTWERANALQLNPQDQAAWNGTLVVFHRGWNGVQTMSDSQFKVWGKFFLYGDPSLIKQLMATTISEESAGN
jgi:hypothetical protein